MLHCYHLNLPEIVRGQQHGFSGKPCHLVEMTDETVVHERPIGGTLSCQELLNQASALNGLWEQALVVSLGFVGVIDEDRFPKIKRNGPD